MINSFKRFYSKKIINKILYCYGCGIQIQHSNPNQLGYSPNEIEIKDNKLPICQRCYKVFNLMN